MDQAGPARRTIFLDNGTQPGPIYLAKDGLRPGPAHYILQTFTARPRQSFFHISRPDPARLIKLNARPTRKGHHTNRPAIYVDPSVNMTRGPMCCPVINDERLYACVLKCVYVLICTYASVFVNIFEFRGHSHSCFRSMRCRYTLMPHERSSAMA